MAARRTVNSLACAAAVLALLVTGRPGHSQPKASVAVPAAAIATRVEAADKSAAGPALTRRMTLRQLSGQNALTLRGTEGGASVTFGSRGDTLVVGGRLTLRYSHSPALIASLSHLKVLLNNELIGVAAFGQATAGAANVVSLDIDPRLIADFNQLRFQFIGHYTDGCEDQLHSALWAEVSGTSELELNLRPVPLVSDLAILPEPFFDSRDLGRLNLPFVLAARPATPVLRAAGVVSSWFGSLADWRGARFPVHFDQPPRGHAVVLATNDTRPAFGDLWPMVEKATLSVVENPIDPTGKLLLVLGRDVAQLEQAAIALTLGHAGLAGPTAQVNKVELQAPRPAYDAPRWVRTDRPTRFGELVENKQALQAIGHSPDRVRIPLRIPPDLFTWRSRGVPVDVRFRHNAPPMHDGASRLTLSVNDELLRSYNLDPGTPADSAQRMRVALLESNLRAGEGSARIPAFTLGPRNQLELGFEFGVPRDGACRDRFVPNVRGEIDPDSTVDFSGFPHYTTLPHLGFFASTGYPFTRFADLSQTLAVLPAAPSSHDVSAFLTLMGRMGESTGVPALHLRVADSAADDADLRDADLLVIGSAPAQGLLARWQAHLPALIHGEQRHLNLPSTEGDPAYDGFGDDVPPQGRVAARVEFTRGGPLGALMGLQHPLSPGRSVVVLTASTSDRSVDVLDALDDTGKQRAMSGSLVLVRADKVSSLRVGPTYEVGSIPLWTQVWYPISRYPLLVAALALVVALLTAFLMWRALRSVIASRQSGGQGNGESA